MGVSATISISKDATSSWKKEREPTLFVDGENKVLAIEGFNDISLPR
jgi:hypothetical protein